MARAIHSTSRCSRLLAILVCGVVGLCWERGGSSKSAGNGGRVASLVPAATEMLVGMGAGDRLVAVSNYESSPVVKDLPRVGDYQSTDWETLARLRPDA